MDSAAAPQPQQTQGRYVCPVCAGRFDSRELLTQMRPKVAAPLRWQHRGRCCPHCDAVLRSRYEQRMTALESGMWFVISLVWIALRGPERSVVDLFLIVLGGAFLYHAVKTVLRHRKDRHAYLRDGFLDPPRTDITTTA